MNGAKPTEIVISRTFNVPRELVWKAWTDPQHVMQWFAAFNQGIAQTSYDRSRKRTLFQRQLVERHKNLLKITVAIPGPDLCCQARDHLSARFATT